MYLNIGASNYRHFPFGKNGKVVVLGVPILKHFRVFTFILKFDYPSGHSANSADPNQLALDLQCRFKAICYSFWGHFVN